MNVFLVIFASGITLVTSMNATLAEAKAYYIGTNVLLGRNDDDLHVAVDVREVSCGY